MECDRGNPGEGGENLLRDLNTLRELQGAGLSELAEKIDKPTSTIHDHLRTLKNEEYLVKKDGEYYVRTRFLGVGEQARSRYKVYPIASEEFDKLAEQTGEHTNLMIEEHGKDIFLYKACRPDAVPSRQKRRLLRTTKMERCTHPICGPSTHGTRTTCHR